MKNSDSTTRYFKAVAVVLILGLTIIYNSNFHLNTLKGELTQYTQADSTRQTVDNESNSKIELVSLTSKLLVSGIKQFISNH